MNIINQLTKDFDFNGKTLTANIDVAWEHEQEDVDGNFDFGNEQENAKYLARFRSGELMAVVIRVRAAFHGMEGSDYLGMCHVHSAKLEDDVIEAAAEHSMVSVAIDELKERLNGLMKEVSHGQV